MLTAVLAAIAITAPAHAGAAAGGTVDITVTPSGFTAPETVRAGTLTLTVRSQDPQGAWVGLVRLRPGVRLERYLRHLKQAMDDDPRTSVAGGRAVSEDVVMLGGAAAGHVPATVTTVVTPGEYHLVDFRDVQEPDFAGRVRPLRVTGPAGSPRSSSPSPSPQPSSLPQPSPAPAVITATDSGFVTPRRLTSGSPVLVVNRSSQFNEAMLMPVRPGTTTADLDAFFSGTGGYPFTAGPTGVVPMSPSRAALLTAALPPGEYALVTWVRNLRTGRMLAQEGMRELVDITPADGSTP
ncbi:hypothetical protein ACFFMN_38175 [Planobispora siamensis]|uniref:Copper(I)-binding protein n=1 Tax=Planobispora siamensis TaxID=936338 RepID=A0A8J3SXG1_9ACTN|nr:hypothetical protein [Planobispora siamensis]GIH97318.1 hypothetical protein Psi01_79480 [Planobispora siamensis]